MLRTVIGLLWIFYIATFVDLTPLKRAEDHARRNDRLAALGRFTSSVANKKRNPLAGIGAGIQYLTRSLHHAGPERENLDFIEQEIRRLDRTGWKQLNRHDR